MKHSLLVLTFAILGATLCRATDARTLAALFAAPSSRSAQECTYIVEYADSMPRGCRVLAVSGSVAVVRAMPRDMARAVREGMVSSVSVSRPLVVHNDRARAICGVDRIVSDFGPYDGRGVVAGIFDIGIDTRHIQFRDAAGRCRISRLLYFPDDSGEFELFDTPEAIAAFGTDDNEETHGTHVLGTMAGNYNGAAMLAAEGTEGGTEGFAPYSGIATGAELAVACGRLTDANMCVAAEYIARYAMECGKPCVINMSIGSVLGPRDATDPVGAFLGALPGEAVTVLSAGNDGTTQCTHTHSYTAGAIAGAYFRGWRPYEPLEFAADFWEDGPDECSVRFVIVDAHSGKVIRTVPFIPGEEGVMEIDFDTDPELAVYYSGTARMAYADNAGTNGRTEYWLECSLAANATDNPTMRYAPGIYFEVTAGRRLDSAMYGPGMYMRLLKPDGWYTIPTSEMSISSLCCHPGTVSVGSMTSRQSWPTIDGTSDCFETPETYPEGRISPYSSSGITVEGVRLPRTVAPGTAILSAYSSAYVAEQGSGTVVAMTKDSEGHTHYWGSYSGTSMATPVVAGSIALWLQANPSLTRAQIASIIEETSVPPTCTDEADTLRWGAGLFDAAQGLRKAIALGELESVATGRPVFTLSGGMLTLSGTSAPLRLYNIAGVCVAAVYPDCDGVCILDTATLPRGFYMAVSTDFNRKIAL